MRSRNSKQISMRYYLQNQYLLPIKSNNIISDVKGKNYIHRDKNKNFEVIIISTMTYEVQKVGKVENVLVILRADDKGKALDEVIELSESGTNLKAFLLYEVDIEPMPTLDEKAEKDFFDNIRREGAEKIEEAVKRLNKAGISTEVLPMHVGIALEDILKKEDLINPNLIIIEKHNHSGFGKYLGGLSDNLIQKAKGPVLVIKWNDKK